MKGLNDANMKAAALETTCETLPSGKSNIELRHIIKLGVC